MKSKYLALAAAGIVAASAAFGCKKQAAQPAEETTAPERIVVAYVTGWSHCMPDPTLMTHINYAFGHVSDSFDSVRIQNPARLDSIVALRQQNPNLKIVLSIGGWGSGNFSEMAADSTLRARFAADCLKKVEQYGLDGIDIDWEYPTRGEGAGISSSPDDTENYTLMMRDLRKALGPDRLLTLATVWTGKFIDFKAIDPYIDYVNIMSYDMSSAATGRPHNPLYASPAVGDRTLDSAYHAHLAAGVPREKLVIGLPFYGRGTGVYPDYVDYKDTKLLPGTVQVWDSIAKINYMADSVSGTILMGFEDERSLAYKLHYIKEQNALGAMYWEYCADDGTLANQVADSILH